MAPRIGLVAAILLGLPALRPATAGTSSTFSPPVSRIPGGIADPAGRTGFVTGTSGSIDVIDLVTGDLLWSTRRAQHPLFVLGDRLYAYAAVQNSGLKVVVLDAGRKGQCVQETVPVALPDWVRLEETRGQALSTRWHLDHDYLDLDWEARAWYAGPLLKPSPKVEAEARREAAGRVRFDLLKGQAEVLAEEPASAPANPPKQLERLAVRWQGVVGNRFQAVTLEEQGSQQKMVLRAWDLVDGKPLFSRDLLEGSRLLVQPSTEDRCLLIRDGGITPPVAGTGAREKAGRSVVSIFSLDSGELLGKAPWEAGTQGMAVLGPRVVYLVAGPIEGPLNRPLVQPRTLKGLDLKSGKVLWERPIEGKRILPPGL
jgi:hypothetical protein